MYYLHKKLLVGTDSKASFIFESNVSLYSGTSLFWSPSDQWSFWSGQVFKL